MADGIDKVPSSDEIKEVFGKSSKTSSGNLVPSKEEIEEVFGNHLKESKKKHHITFFVFLGIIVVLIGAYVYFEDELIEYTGRSIGVNESLVESLRSYFIEEIDLNDRSRFGVELSEIYIDLNQEEKALMALLDEQCDGEKDSLALQIREDERERCAMETESLEEDVTSLESQLSSCQSEVSDLEYQLSQVG